MENSSLSFPKLLSGTSLAVALTLILFVLSWAFDRSLILVFLPWFSTAFGVVLLGAIIIPFLRMLKAGQVIREDGPQTHLQKAGTPTMGGIFVVPVALLGALLWTQGNLEVIVAIALTTAFAFVGWIDDWQILRYKSNKGISPSVKLGLLGVASIAFCAWMLWQKYPQVVDLPWGKLPLGLAFWALALFVLLGTSNATNLTDGLDGLAGGTGAIAAFALGLLLQHSHPNLGIFCWCISGAYLGFLWHNRNPAQVFMGDTGSLALGGALAAAALLGNVLWGLLIVGGLFVWESLTTIAQVVYYKATKNEEGIGKRLFKMAPFHHHLELSGWTETQIVGIFYGIGLLLLTIALFLGSRF